MPTFGPAQPEDDVGDEVGEREERGDEEEPERLRVGDDGDLDREQPRRGEDRHGGDHDDEQPERREDQPAEQRDQDRPDDAVDEREDRAPQEVGEDAAADRLDDRRRVLAERERLRDLDQAEDEDDRDRDQPVDGRLDEETAHGSPSGRPHGPDGASLCRPRAPSVGRTARGCAGARRRQARDLLVEPLRRVDLAGVLVDLGASRPGVVGRDAGPLGVAGVVGRARPSAPRRAAG